jgi:hypothetical protein
VGADKDIIRKDSKDAGKRASEVGKKTNTEPLRNKPKDDKK